MGAVIVSVFAALSTAGAILFVLLTTTNPYADVTRAFTSLIAAALVASSLGLWILVGVLVGRPGDAEPPGDPWKHPDR